MLCKGEDYVNSMDEKQENIYYACGETIDKINLLPQVEQVKKKNYEYTSFAFKVSDS